MNALDIIDGITALAHPDERILYGLAQGELSPDRAAIVERHLARCPHCRELTEMFGWSANANQPAKVVQLPNEGKAAGARLQVLGSSPSRAAANHLGAEASWRLAAPERLAASDAEISKQGADPHRDELVQLIPGATHGSVALGYLCAGGVEVVVTGADDRPARVSLSGADYEVRDGRRNGPRVVEGLTRADIAVWLAGGSVDGFKIVYP